MSTWIHEEERKILDMNRSSDEYKVFVQAKDDIDLSAGYSGPIKLEETYREYQAKYFKGRVPDLSDSFICAFQSLPYDTSGITIMLEENRIPDVKKGIRINECLEKFRSETQVALLHEMIHATGIIGHGKEFKQEILRLIIEGAYGDFSPEGEFAGIL